MDMVPRGATIFVEAIWAPQSTVCSKARGMAMRAALEEHSLVGLHWPLLVRRSLSERMAAAYIIRKAVTHSARVVPSAAPATPMLAPGMVSPKGR